MRYTTNTNVPEAASLHARAQRASELRSLIRDATIDAIHVEGGERSLDTGPAHDDRRQALWLARLMLGGSADDIALANELIHTVEWDHACHFCGMAAGAILLGHSERIDRASCEKLTEYLASCAGPFMTNDRAFVGANDNCGFGSAGAVSLFGTLTKNSAMLRSAAAWFEIIHRTADLRGMISECASPTYSPISIVYLADVAEFSSDEATRRMALRIEQRVWQELLLQFHPGLGHFVGPFSRAYPGDQVAGCSMAQILFYVAFGKVGPADPVNVLFPPAKGLYFHGSWHWLRMAAAMLAAPVYHPPLAVAAACLDPDCELPRTVRADHEFCAMGASPSGASSSTTHMRKNLALGSFSSRTWTGQNMPVHGIYRRFPADAAEPAIKHLASVRSFFTRCHVSDAFSGETSHGLPFDPAMLLDQGASFATQSETNLLVGYVPTEGGPATRIVRTSLVFPLHASTIDEIQHGTMPLPAWSASFAERDWFFLRDGDFYLAAHPLVAKEAPIFLSRQQYSRRGDYAFADFVSLCTFGSCGLEEATIRECGAALFIQVSDSSVFSEFSKFQESARETIFSDNLRGPERHLRATGKDFDLELIYDIQHLRPRRISHETREKYLSVSPQIPLID